MSTGAPMHVLIVGRGRLGSSVAGALRTRGQLVTHWPGRGRWPAWSPDAVDVALLAVGDPFLEATATRLAARLGPRCPVLHASGSRDATVLAPLAPRPCGVLHPLVSFASRRAPTLRGATAVIGGDARAVRAARALAAHLELDVLARDLHGPRYHATAALVANGAAALAAEGVRSLEAQGVPRRAAERAIAGLLRSVADNVASVGVPGALTGPIVRGDATTVARHRGALDRETLAAYDAIAPTVLAVAIEAGLPEAGARAIRAALHQRKK